MKGTKIKLEIARNIVRLMIAEARYEIAEAHHSDEAESEMETIENLFEEAKVVESLLCEFLD